MDQYIFRKDRTGYQKEGVRGGYAYGHSSYEKSDHKHYSSGGVQVLDKILYQIRNDVFSLSSIQSGHHADGYQPDEHTAAPDNDLKYRGDKHQFTLGLERGTGIAGTYEYMGEHDGPSDGAAERVTEPGAVGNQFIGTGIGEPVVAVFPHGPDGVPERTMEADDQADDHNSPEDADVDQPLDRVGHNNGFHAADDHVYDDYDSGDQQDVLIFYRSPGSDLRGLGNGDQNGCDSRERGT